MVADEIISRADSLKVASDKAPTLTLTLTLTPTPDPNPKPNPNPDPNPNPNPNQVASDKAKLEKTMAA